MDKWLTRAQKMHNDDFLLTLCKRRPTKLQEPRLTTKTAAQHQRLSHLEGHDVTDAGTDSPALAMEAEGDREKLVMPRLVVTMNHWEVLKNTLLGRGLSFPSTSAATDVTMVEGPPGGREGGGDEVDYVPSRRPTTKNRMYKLKQYEHFEHYGSDTKQPSYMWTKWASFTWWITIVQLICFIVTMSVYGVANIGGLTTTIRGEVMTSSLSVEEVSYEEDSNIWIGPRLSDLIHIGARYTPCMRDDINVRTSLDKARNAERNSACCVLNDGSGCLQTTDDRCSDVLATWLKWSTDNPGPDNRLSGSVCGQDPRYCATPLSVGAFTWKDDIIEWPICTKTNNVTSRSLSLRHMTCPLAGRPCCIGNQGQCVITTREYCEFRRGFFHPEATLCSQVSCLSEICGMIPFHNPDKPDQFYRFWISLFLHFGILHMLFTLLIQLIIMRRFEKMIGWLRVIIIYTVCGMAANVFSGIFLPYFVTVGPTGSQAGILAAFFLETLSNRQVHDYWKWASTCLAAFFICLLVIGLFVPMIDNYAILVGTVLGLPLAFALLPFVAYDRHNERKNLYRKIGVALSLFLVVGAFVILIIVFYLAPLYTCPNCHYFNCIPITATYCRSSEIRIITSDDY